MRKSLATFCLETGHEELLRQWEQERNAPLTPEAISYGSKRKVWWHCSRGHSWQAPPYARTGGETGCPYCAGRLPIPGETDLGTVFPNLAQEWHPTKNGSLTPQQVLPGSYLHVWWRCSNGHEWMAQIKSRVSGCGCPLCAHKTVQPGKTDLATVNPTVAAQWHPTKNGALTPRDVLPGTSRRVWWLCEKGHSWQAAVSSRALGGSKCPYCTGRKVRPGENDLATAFPEIAAQWHPTKNGSLTPQQVTPNSNRKVWWICPLGHEYQSWIPGRTRQGGGCPYCAGKKVLPGFNDLATRVPEIAAQWHPTLNGALTPSMVSPGSHRKVWWICPEGHVWKAVIHSRAGSQKSGCPVCAGRIRQKKGEIYAKTAANIEDRMRVSG